MTETDEDRAGSDRRDRRQCEVCGESVPAVIYREHLLKECSGDRR